MESRSFIKAAAALIVEITEFASAILSNEEELAQGQSIQRQINAAFSGLQNPTLPSAGKLCTVATRAGFSVNPQVVQRLQQAESMWY